jgi:hypothetical protein
MWYPRWSLVVQRLTFILILAKLFMYRFLILSILLLSLLGSASAQTVRPTLDEYKQWVREAYAAATRSDRIGLDDVAERLGVTHEVVLPNSSTVPVDNTWLNEALAQEPPEYQRIAARLGAILDAFGQPRTALDPDALDKLDEVFRKPPFANRAVPTAWTRFWQAAAQTISDFLNWLLNRGAGGQAGTPAPFSTLSPLGWALMIAGLALVLGLVAYAIHSIRQSILRDAQVRAAATAHEAYLSSGDAWTRAHEQARAHDYRTAMRYLYLSSLLWLDERKLLHYDRSLTNREHLEQVQTNPSLHGRLAPIVNTFDRIWYGHRELDERAFQTYKQAIEALRNEELQS